MHEYLCTCVMYVCAYAYVCVCVFVSVSVCVYKEHNFMFPTLCDMQISRQTWVKLIEEVVLGRLNWAAVIVSVLCMTFLVLVRLINKKLWKFPKYKKLPIPIPSQLIAVSQLMYLHMGINCYNFILIMSRKPLMVLLCKNKNNYSVNIIGGFYPQIFK